MDVSAQDARVHPEPTSVQVRRSLIAASLLVIILWFIPFGHTITLPFRYFVTFLHELSHALAAVFTHGSASQMQIARDGSGSVQVIGGWRFLVAAAGYIGTTFFGATLLLLSQKPKLATSMFYILFAVILFTTVWWVSPIFSFGFWTGIILAGLLLLAGLYVKGKLSIFLLQFLAVQCCLSALWDLSVLMRLNTAGIPDNDAAFLASFTHIPAIVWSILWTLFSALILWQALKRTWKNGKEPRAIEQGF
ncbi:MAG: M50 family metallopeptidase [bacterium]